MSIQPRPYYSFENYLATERESVDDKHEYVAGQVFAVAGATFNHNLITTNLSRLYRESRAATRWERLQPRRGLANCRNHDQGRKSR